MPRLRPRAVIPRRKLETDTVLSDRISGSSRSDNGDSTYLEKILVYIPIESVALYQVTLNQLGQTDPFFDTAIRWIWYATPFWILYSTHKTGEPLAWDQAITSVPAYLFWLAGLQSPFIVERLKAWQITWKEGYGTLALIVGSMALPVLGTIVLSVVDWIRSFWKGQ